MNDKESLNTSNLVVHVIEDDDAMRESLGSVLTSAGYEIVLYASPERFMADFDERPGCMVIDLRLPGISGIELYRRLFDKGMRYPFIMISGNAGIQHAVESMKLGAVDFLEKPFRAEALAACIDKAFQIVRVRMDTIKRIGTLTPRELEFMKHIQKGLGVKEISAILEISPKTGHIHRRNVHRKMNVDCDAALVRLLQQSGESEEPSPTPEPADPIRPEGTIQSGE